MADELKLALGGVDLGEELADALGLTRANGVLVKVKVNLELEGLAANGYFSEDSVSCYRLNNGQRCSCSALRRRHDHDVVCSIEFDRNLTLEGGVSGQGCSALLGVLGVGKLTGVNDLVKPGCEIN